MHRWILSLFVVSAAAFALSTNQLDDPKADILAEIVSIQREAAALSARLEAHEDQAREVARQAALAANTVESIADQNVELASDGNTLRLELDNLGSRMGILRRKVHALPLDPPPVIVDPPKTDPPTDPPKTDPPSGGVPWTHAYRGAESETVKGALPPGWAEAWAAAPPRTLRKGSVRWNPGQEINISNLDLTGPEHSYEQKLLNIFRTVPNTLGAPARFYNLTLQPMPWEKASGLKWFARIYNLESLHVELCSVVGTLYGTNGARPDEHGFYFNTYGDSYVGFSLFQDIQGHGAYLAHRDEPYQQYPPDNLPYTASPTHVVEFSRFIDTEQGAAKGSFSITHFDGGNEEFPGKIILRGNVIVQKYPWQRAQGSNVQLAPDGNKSYIRACGAFVHNSYQHQDDFALTEYIVDGNVIHLTQARHAIGVVRNTQTFRLANSCVETDNHSQPFIDVGGKNDSLRGNQKLATDVWVENSVSESGAQVRIWNDDNTFVLLPIETPGVTLHWNRATGKTTSEPYTYAETR